MNPVALVDTIVAIHSIASNKLHMWIPRTLEAPSEAEQAEREPSAFLARHGTPLIVDEVQYAPGLFRHLKAAVDANRAHNGQFVLTGSQKLTLMQAVSESLAGRAELVEGVICRAHNPYPVPGAVEALPISAL